MVMTLTSTVILIVVVNKKGKLIERFILPSFMNERIFCLTSPVKAKMNLMDAVSYL